tara:strand:+ start:8298 stop:9266 length:969 start_codon:yes stop_codon:yes gene_type:complete
MFAQDANIKWFSVLYILAFFVSFFTYVSLLDYAQYSIYDFTKLIKFIIYSYCVVLFLQQVCVLLNIPIINSINYDANVSVFKLNSLALEPSWTGRVVALLMLCFLMCNDKIQGIKISLRQSFIDNQKLWLAFLWVQFTSISVTCILTTLILFSRFLRFKEFILSLLFMMGLIFILEYTDTMIWQRILAFSEAVITLDKDNIINADGSGAVRLVSYMNSFSVVSLSSFEDFFGYYDVYNQKTDTLYIYEAFGGLLTTWLLYGAGFFLIFCAFSMYIVIDIREPVTFIYWILLVFFYSIGIKIIWLTLIFFYTFKKTSLDLSKS